MAAKQFASIKMIEAAFGQFPKRFERDGKTYAVKSQIQSWTVTGGTNPYFRFLVVLDTDEQANIYKFVKSSGDLWKLDVTDEKVEA